MCGILGLIGSNSGDRSLDLGRIGHRGPDGHGQQKVGAALLGHTRLSIIDLGGGAQPMTSVDGVATIAFNGEIYNYRELRADLAARGVRFATNSDTEVVLATYITGGIAALERLRGMYAFALADKRTGETLLARDPFGIKPLFYHHEHGRVAFSSEQAALLSLLDRAPEIDRTSLLETLIQRYPTGPHSLYRGVQRLEPGTALVRAPDGTVRFERFASLAGAVERERERAPRWDRDSVSQRVADTIAHHTIADVPLGCFLSGGLDSSIVAQQLAENASTPIRAYTVSFASGGGETSELPFAQAVADQVGADLTVVPVSGDDFAELAPLLSGTPNGPFPDPADVAMYRMSLVAARDVKVVLSGEGSDEAFAGYPKYAFDRYAALVPGWLPRAVPLDRFKRAGIALEALAENDRARRWMGWFQNADAPSSLIASLVEDGAERGRALAWTERRIASYPREWSDMQRMQVLDLDSWLPNNLLHRGDYTTMQASLEQRVPFLDRAFTPWAVALPDSAKVAHWRGKQALRRAFAAKLPPAVIARRKSGFRLPLGSWLSAPGKLQQLANDMLAGPGARLGTWMSPAELAAILSPARLATTKGAKLAWTALSIELWLRALEVRDERRGKDLTSVGGAPLASAAIPVGPVA